jgi:hypothetical protein
LPQLARVHAADHPSAKHQNPHQRTFPSELRSR